MIALETDRLILRDYTAEDFAAYFRLMTDDRTMYWLQDLRPASEAEARSRFGDILADLKRTERTFVFLHMELKDGREQVGSIGYTVTARTPVGKLVHLGYFTYPRFWGHGLTTEALRTVLRYAFEADGVYRVTTGCLAENRASERVMRKCGLIREAEHVDWEWHDGRMKTRLEYRMLRSEWERARFAGGENLSGGLDRPESV